MAAKVSVILPIFNSAKYLSKTIDSVIAQTFTDWELLAVNEFGSNDGSADIVRIYAREDGRIRLVQNEEHLGLAGSLNEGFRRAEGEYLARLDAEDIACPDRLEKQVAFINDHPETGICAGRRSCRGELWPKASPVEPKDVKAALLFGCDICPDTLMMRRDVILDNGLLYDADSPLMDYEMLSRASLVTGIAVLSEALTKRLNEAAAPLTMDAAATEEQRRITARTLRIGLDMDVQPEQIRPGEQPGAYEALLRDIFSHNKVSGIFEPKSLLKAIDLEWKRAKLNGSWTWSGARRVDSIDEVFGGAKAARPAKSAKSAKSAKKPAGPLQKAKEKLRRWHKSLARDSVREIKKNAEKLNGQNEQEIASRIKALGEELEKSQEIRLASLGTQVDKKIERWTWERYGRIKKDLAPLKQALDELQKPEVRYVPYHRGEKIRIGILFQIPSCWPSLETVWETLQTDERFEVKMYLYDEEQKEPAQMAGARQFLIDREIPFTVVDRYTFAQAKLHILLYQTPWDDAHRPRWLQSDMISQLGIRIAYVLYGLSYSSSVWLGHQFSDTKMKARPWRMFTTTERMRFDHIVLSPRGGHNVVAVGHPKFDAIARKENYPLEQSVLDLAAGRRLVFLQMHFAEKMGNPSIPEPDVHSYIEFLRHAEVHKEEFFFLARPHPKMLEYYEQHDMPEEAEELRELFAEAENVYLYDAPDYRPALFAADCVVGDRSALLLEAAALDIPVLYMTNFYYKEKILPAVEPVFNSFYQGSFAYDIRLFLDFVVLKGNDYKREERREAARKCLPPLDGMGGKRIVDAIADAIYEEAAEDA